MHNVSTHNSNDINNFVDKVEWEVLIPSINKIVYLESKQLSDFIQKFKKFKIPTMRILHKKDRQVSSLFVDNISTTSTGSSSESSISTEKTNFNNELSVQYDDGRSPSVEEEHQVPECCTGTVGSIDFCLFCGEDGKNYRFNENAICKYVDTKKPLEIKTVKHLKNKYLLKKQFIY